MKAIVLFSLLFAISTGFAFDADKNGAYLRPIPAPKFADSAVSDCAAFLSSASAFGKSCAYLRNIDGKYFVFFSQSPKKSPDKNIKISESLFWRIYTIISREAVSARADTTLGLDGHSVYVGFKDSTGKWVCAEGWDGAAQGFESHTKLRQILGALEEGAKSGDFSKAQKLADDFYEIDEFYKISTLEKLRDMLDVDYAKLSGQVADSERNSALCNAQIEGIVGKFSEVCKLKPLGIHSCGGFSALLPWSSPALGKGERIFLKSAKSAAAQGATTLKVSPDFRLEITEEKNF